MEQERKRSKLRTYSAKLKKTLLSVQSKYDALLKSTLRASRRSYMRGRLEVFKRVAEELEKRKLEFERDYKRSLMGLQFQDVPRSKSKVDSGEEILTNAAKDSQAQGFGDSRASLQTLDLIEKGIVLLLTLECLGRRSRPSSGLDQPELPPPSTTKRLLEDGQ